jgi:hypothetical protein
VQSIFQLLKCANDFPAAFPPYAAMGKPENTGKTQVQENVHCNGFSLREKKIIKIEDDVKIQVFKCSASRARQNVCFGFCLYCFAEASLHKQRVLIVS